jgi:hypothetical protein
VTWPRPARAADGAGSSTEEDLRHYRKLVTGIPGELERLKWFLWHGTVVRALQVTDNLEFDLEIVQDAGPEYHKLLKTVREFSGYLRANAGSIPNAWSRNNRCAGPPGEHTSSSKSAPESSTTPSPTTSTAGTPSSLTMASYIKNWTPSPNGAPPQPDESVFVARSRQPMFTVGLGQIPGHADSRPSALRAGCLASLLNRPGRLVARGGAATTGSPPMTVARSAAEVLAAHVTLEVECIDRMYLNVYVPKLQYVGGVVSFLRKHRGDLFASSALLDPISRAFVGALYAFGNDSLI